MRRARVIAVIGAGSAPAGALRLAHEVGREIARRGVTLINGGRSGVMEAAAEGARKLGGHTIGILPSYERSTANRHIEFAIVTGMGEARNAIIVASADAIIALAGEGGTLAEIGFAMKMNRPIVALQSWPEIAGLHRADTPADAVALALKLAGRRGG
ncbi:MAG TPA: TIGR00725 family protein [Candidatus Binataceae bacterium]|nr:TIGR00725 family protein [Candidatus Binataceae bacterium]